MHKFQDLRFSIGLFFALVGLLLILAGFLDPEDRADLNYISGAVLFCFGLLGLKLAPKSV